MMGATMIRLGLGTGQMFCSALSLVLMIDRDISEVSLAAVTVTCDLPSISVLVSGKRLHNKTTREDAPK
jgi:hypothetical protein